MFEVIIHSQELTTTSFVTLQAKYDIPCLELPLIEHIQGPDRNRLTTVLSGK